MLTLKREKCREYGAVFNIYNSTGFLQNTYLHIYLTSTINNKIIILRTKRGLSLALLKTKNIELDT